MYCILDQSLVFRAPCNNRGLCLETYCLCNQGYSNQSDWIDGSCIKDVEGIKIANIILTSLAFLAFCATLFKAFMLFRQKRYTTAKISVLMSLPPLIIGTYCLITLITNEKNLKDSVVLTVLMILLNLVWQIGAIVINRWLILSTASATSFNNPEAAKQAKYVVWSLTTASAIVFVALAVLHILLLIYKFDIIHRIYTTIMSFYVLSHIAPYLFSRKMEMHIQEHIRMSNQVGSEDRVEKRLNRLSNNMANIRSSFSGTIMYLHNIIFVLFTDFSPYYLQINFILGIISAVGCYRLFPNKEDTSNNSSTLSDSGRTTMVIKTSTSDSNF